MEMVINKPASSLQVERSYSPDRGAMAAALRLVLGLPKVPVTLAETECLK
jgi:hypothetical protein